MLGTTSGHILGKSKRAEEETIMKERLNHEILFDIFSSRLSIISLLRLRCASKSFRNMIDDPYFVRRHLSRAYPEQPGQIFIMDYNKDLILFGLLREDGRGGLKTSLLMEFPGYYGSFDLYNSCNGLLCFSNFSCSIVVYNPNTIRKESLVLPRSTKSKLPRQTYTNKSYGLGHDPSTNTYKVIHVYFFNKEFTKTEDMQYYNVEIHTLGTSSWRTISAKPVCPTLGKPVFAYGALHWKPYTSLELEYNMEGMLVSFDIANEVFYLTPHPGFQNFHLVDFGGSLGLVDLSSDMQIEIWLLKDCCGGNGKKKEREWVKEYKIYINAPREVIRKLVVVGMRENGEILLRSDRRLFSYNLKTDELRYIFMLKLLTQVYAYRGSLVSLAGFK